MPTVLRVDGYRFFFYANDGFEPPHVHVEYDGRIAKIWLLTLLIARDGGFPDHRLVESLRIVADHRGELLEKWNAFFNVQG